MLVICFDKMQAGAFRQLNTGQIWPSLMFPMYSFTLDYFQDLHQAMSEVSPAYGCRILSQQCFQHEDCFKWYQIVCHPLPPTIPSTFISFSSFLIWVCRISVVLDLICNSNCILANIIYSSMTTEHCNVAYIQSQMVSSSSF